MLKIAYRYGVAMALEERGLEKSAFGPKDLLLVSGITGGLAALGVPFFIRHAYKNLPLTERMKMRVTGKTPSVVDW